MLTKEAKALIKAYNQQANKRRKWLEAAYDFERQNYGSHNMLFVKDALRAANMKLREEYPNLVRECVASRLPIPPLPSFYFDTKNGTIAITELYNGAKNQSPNCQAEFASYLDEAMLTVAKRCRDAIINLESSMDELSKELKFHI